MVVPIQANIIPTAEMDGILYAAAVPLTPTEADLFGGTGAGSPDPIPVTYGQIIVAVVQLAISGFITGNNTFLALQTDMGDNVWIDMDWVVWNQVQGSAKFVFSGGVIGATNNVFQQSRNAGSMPTPQANGSNGVPLMGRCRFTGFSNPTGGSSSAPGVNQQVTATIRYKLLTPR